MAKITARVLDMYPEVEVFVSREGGKLKRGGHAMHLLKSNGVNMLVATKSGEVLFLSLSEIAKVSPRNNDFFVCRVDPPTGALIYRPPNSEESLSAGPVRGSPDPNINLAAVAKELGFDLRDVIGEGSGASKSIDPSIPTKSALTPAEAAEGPREKSYEELVQPATTEDDDFSLDDMDAPDLSGLEIDDLLDSADES